jgi:hypothetical protein
MIKITSTRDAMNVNRKATNVSRARCRVGFDGRTSFSTTAQFLLASRQFPIAKMNRRASQFSFDLIVCGRQHQTGRVEPGADESR